MSNIINLNATTQLAAIIENSEDAMICITTEGIIVSWNLAAMKIYGHTEKETLGKHISIIIPPSLMEEEENILSAIKAGQKVDTFETIRLTKSGALVPVSLAISPLRDNEGAVVGALEIARDISIQQQTEKKVALLASIVDSSWDTIVSKTLDGIITSWNKSAERMFGYSEAEAIGKHISLIIPADRLDEENMIISRIRSGLKVDHFETLRKTKTGRLINISLTVSPIRDKSGKIIGASKIARDITEQVETREKLEQYTKKLEQINNYKDEFISMASHELKTPITSINGYLQLLERNMKAGPQVLFLKKASQQVSKLMSLISDLLDISKIQSGRLSLNLTRFNLCELLRETVETVQQTSTFHTLQLEAEDGLWLIADKQRLEQVVINLLTNSIKYSPESPQIFIKGRKEGGNILVSVQDFGIGIPPEKQKKIFDRFYRVEGLEYTYSGLGLGLYISNEIIAQHQGKMWVQSELEKGSTFFVQLKAVQ